MVQHLRADTSFCLVEKIGYYARKFWGLILFIHLSNHRSQVAFICSSQEIKEGYLIPSWHSRATELFSVQFGFPFLHPDFTNITFVVGFTCYTGDGAIYFSSTLQETNTIKSILLRSPKLLTASRYPYNESVPLLAAPPAHLALWIEEIYKGCSIPTLTCKWSGREKSVCGINMKKYMHSIYLPKETEFDSPAFLYRQSWCW